MDETVIKIAVMETEIKALNKQVEVLVDKIEKLTEVMNKGKGAFAFALFMSGTIGAGVATLISHVWK